MIIKFSLLAEKDLADIWQYISLDNENIANTFILALRDRIADLSKFPFLGVVKKGLEAQGRVLRFKKYNIVYRIETDAIKIARIFHEARQVKDLL